MAQDFLSFVNGRTGHFKLESGHHSNHWLDLETLCLLPSRIQPFAAQLANRLRPYNIEGVCGPLNEGAFVALMTALALGCEYTYAERFAQPQSNGLFPVEYRIPKTLHSIVRGKRIAIVNDVISAGSAVRGTLNDLRRHEAQVVVVASLLVMGKEFSIFAHENKLPFESLAEVPFEMWTPEECPLCRGSSPVETVG
jgi:orotate phosphoribosyltransferase